jgi:Flp pilus assembly protein TadG
MAEILAPICDRDDGLSVLRRLHFRRRSRIIAILDARSVEQTVQNNPGEKGSRSMTSAPRRRVRRDKRFGQALPEFALTLPIFLLILLIAVDFGRLFQGWITLQNATRIAANYGAAAPKSSFGPGSVYETTVRNESNNSQCSIATIPAPTFSPNKDVGSTATVSMTCNFKLLTPFIGKLVGDPLPLSATSTFTVRTGDIAGVPLPSVAPCTAPNLIVPNLVGLTVQDARNAWTAAGFTMDAAHFDPNTGHNGETVTGQIPDAGACRASSQFGVVTY